ncbi:uncharacterized protein [Miscanthus floridulus]|uniref:uncharacterized protein n=1 Tax=Miscanthus floridulus TaxID=154761 RepID=UPI00345809BD
MKAQVDKRRSERSFEVGDSVFLRLQLYVQSSLAPRSHHKLCFKYFEPFKVGVVAYKLALPPTSIIDPVVHVSLLKPAPPSAPAITAELPDPDDMLQVSERVLQTRLHQHSANTVQQMLIKWSSLDDDLATWEDVDAIMQRFLGAPSSQWGGMSVGLILAAHLRHPSPRDHLGGRQGM